MSETPPPPTTAAAPAWLTRAELLTIDWWLTRAELLTIDWCQQRLYVRLIDAWTAAPDGAVSRAQLDAEIARCEEARRLLDRLWHETALLPGIPEPGHAGTWFG